MRVLSALRSGIAARGRLGVRNLLVEGIACSTFLSVLPMFLLPGILLKTYQFCYRAEVGLPTTNFEYGMFSANVLLFALLAAWAWTEAFKIQCNMFWLLANPNAPQCCLYPGARETWQSRSS